MVQVAVKAFFNMLPGMKKHQEKLQWTAYAGWKQVL